jgi:chemotaxis protein CheC
MITPSSLNDLEKDAISEVFNIGISRSAASLSEMVGKEVLLSVPSLSISQFSEAVAELSSSSGNISGVLEEFDGSVAGNAILLFPHDKTMELMKLIYPPEMTDDILLEMEDDTMSEIGNILLNATLSSLSEILDEEILNQIPKTISGSVEDVLHSSNMAKSGHEHVLRMNLTMTIADANINGEVSFLIIIKSIQSFKQKLAQYFGLPLS